MARAAVTVEHFKRQMIASGLVPDGVLSQHISSEISDAEQLSRLLVKQKLLTPYQARQLLAGKGTTLVLGNYVVLEKLGQGGMGMVLKARHRRMDRIVALKILSTNVTKNATAAKRFQREVKAAARLEHPNIVSALDADEVNGTPFLVMQFVEGTDLSALVKKNGPLAVDHAISCVLQAANGLRYAHEQGVIHRDIKPANLFLDRSGTVKVLDMGLARLESEGVNQDELTGTGQIMGTIDYMAPEQAADTKNADVRADIYSLGVTLWYLLTGSALYPAGSTVMKLMAHQNQPIPSLCEACPAATAALQNVFRRMVAKSPDERFQSMADLIVALEQCRRGSSSSPISAVAVDNVDASLATFLRDLESSPDSPAAIRVKTTKKVVRGKDERTAMLLAADVDTDPHSQLSLPPRQRAAREKVLSKPATSTSKRTWIVTASVISSLLIMSAVLFFLRTKYGVIRVEITDPEIEVQLKGTDIVLKAADQGKDVRVTVGEQSLVIQRDDFTFETDKLVLKKDEVTTVRVELVAGEIVVRDGDTLLGHASLPEETPGIVSTSTTAEPPTQTGVAEWGGWSKDAPAPAIVPFDSVKAREHQEAWAAHLKLPVEYTNSLGMRFRLIPPGEFVMGSTRQEIQDAIAVPRTDQLLRSYIESEAPQHTVVLTQPVYLGVHEVTEGQYEKVMGVNPVRPLSNQAAVPPKSANHPVTMVSWYDAVGFSNKLSLLEHLAMTKSVSGLTEAEPSVMAYRLPTEAEWEFSCRAGTTTRYWNGDTDTAIASTAWTNSNSGNRTHIVGELDANAFGLYDQTGNVWEWVADSWTPTTYQERVGKLTIDPFVVRTEDSIKSIRGGSFTYYNANCRSSHRFSNHSKGLFGNCGFRVALKPESVRALLESAARAASESMPEPATSSDAALPAPAVSPFDAQAARTHQEAWANHLGVPMEYTNTLGMKFRLIPPGEFLMGSTPEEIDTGKSWGREDALWQESMTNEGPVRSVAVNQPFYLASHEVTQKAYFELMHGTPSFFCASGRGSSVVNGIETTSLPVESVTWDEAAEFCTKLCSHESTPGYRLPTETEWEFACRAGTATPFWSGNSESDLMTTGWFADNADGRPHPVGELAANPFGIFDMHGNVNEWCSDEWTPKDFVEALDATSNEKHRWKWKILRGGSCLYPGFHSISSRRLSFHNEARWHFLGFRVALSIDAVRDRMTSTPSEKP